MEEKEFSITPEGENTKKKEEEENFFQEISHSEPLQSKTKRLKKVTEEERISQTQERDLKNSTTLRKIKKFCEENEVSMVRNLDIIFLLLFGFFCGVGSVLVCFGHWEFSLFIDCLAIMALALSILLPEGMFPQRLRLRLLDYLLKKYPKLKEQKPDLYEYLSQGGK